MNYNDVFCCRAKCFRLIDSTIFLMVWDRPYKDVQYTKDEWKTHLSKSCAFITKFESFGSLEFMSTCQVVAAGRRRSSKDKSFGHVIPIENLLLSHNLWKIQPMKKSYLSFHLLNHVSPNNLGSRIFWCSHYMIQLNHMKEHHRYSTLQRVDRTQELGKRYYDLL
jgi:hypothetical protein